MSTIISGMKQADTEQWSDISIHKAAAENK